MNDRNQRIAALTPEQRQALLARLGRSSVRGADAIPRLGQRSWYPASFAQERMWFLRKLNPDDSHYAGTACLRLRGPLDRTALARSIAEIVQRHEVLRSTVEDRDGALVQVPRDGAAVFLKEIDLRQLSPEAAAERASAALIEERDLHFDLTAGPLFRAVLVMLGDDEHLLLLSAHHIVADGWSLDRLAAELAQLYGAFRAGQPSPLAALPIQYGDYAAWERQRLSAAVLQRKLEYWKTQLDGVSPLRLGDRPGGTAAVRVGATTRLPLTPALTAALRALSRDSKASLFMTLLAAFDALIYRTTGQHDLAVGTPIANRQRAEVEPLIGFFVNLLVLRTQVNGQLGFRTLLERVRRTALDAYEHQDVPFEKLVEELRPQREGGRNPLVQVTLGVQTSSLEGLSLAGLDVSMVPVDEPKTRFDLELHAWDRGGQIEIEAFFDSSIFDRSSIDMLLHRYVRVLEQVTADPDIRIDDVSLVSAAERSELIAHGMGARPPYPRDETLPGLFAAVAAAHAGAIAVEDGDTAWTYRELSDRAGGVAAALRQRGVGPGDCVGIWLDRGADLIAAIVGISVAGGVYVPLEISQPASRAAGALTDTGAAIVLTSAALSEAVPAGPWQALTMEALRDQPADGAAAPAGIVAEDLAYVLYTSGSTGRPKGVAVPHRAVIRLVCGTDFVSLGPSTVTALASSPAFDAATFEIWGALLNGGRIVVIPSTIAMAPGALGAYFQRTGVTTTFLTAALVHQIGQENPGVLRGLDTLLAGGDALEPRWIAAIQQAGGPRRLLNGYGPTENTTFSATCDISATKADDVTVPIGGPIAQSSCYVVDRNGELVPTGVPGELLVGGDGLAQMYVAAPRLTAERFVPDGISGASGARLYRTGDIVRWRRPGLLEFLGRRDGQIKLRGHRIELGEVESALAAVPGVGAGVVIVDGRGVDKRLVAYVTPLPGASLESRDVREQLKRALPPYMVPAVVLVLAAMPLNANGKIDRSALPKPDAGSAGVDQGRAPRGQLQQQIAQVWCRALGVAAVGIDDAFFDLGGHSLLLVRVHAALETALGRSIPLVTLFQYPTIAALAAHLEGEQPDEPVRSTAAAPPPPSEPVAIVGLAGRFPEAPDLETFWANLRAGRATIRQFSPEELLAAGVPGALLDDPRFVGARGVLDDADLFDADLFGYTPREATLLDPQHRLLLECAWTALEHAGYAPGTRQKVRIGVYAGCTDNGYGQRAPSHETLTAADSYDSVLGRSRDFLATRISYKLQLTGPAVTVQTACSTSLVALHAACQAIKSGECDVAVAGGVSVTVPPIGGYLYEPEGIVSPDGQCRPFDAKAAGTVAGNGVGVVVLKALSRALAEGDTIHAVVRGTAINNDGADKVGFTAPSVSGQAAVVAAAQAAAGVSPETISFIEAHGTGTALGDPIEVAALRQVWADAPRGASCALGSVKSNLGHLDAAAGIAGVIKAVLALQHREIPPTVHFEAVNPQIDLGPFHVPSTVVPWAAGGSPRRAGISSFGMGGTNAHAVLEEAPAQTESETSRAWQVVPVSGRNEAAVLAAAQTLAAALSASSELPLADVAYTQQVGRTSMRVRMVAAGRTHDELAAALRAGVPAPVAGDRPSSVWVFPGQGTQLLGMGRGLYDSEPIFRAEMDACALAAAGVLGGDLREILYAPPEQETAAASLATTTWTQVALVSVELALAALWRAWGLVPDMVIGHSVGEIAAACVAGVMSRDAAVSLAATRGQLMHTAPPGGMLAVGAAAADVERRLPPELSLAAINSPSQCVVAGPHAALDRFELEITASGLAAQRLPAAGAFHSPLMAGVAQPLTAFAAGLKRVAPQVSWVSTATGEEHTAASATDPGYWGRQVTARVEWSRATEAARRAAGGPVVWLEVGPGHTLTRLIASSMPAGESSVTSLDRKDDVHAMTVAVGELWRAGLAPDWRAYHGTARRRRVPLPPYPFQRQRYWLESAAQTDVQTSRGRRDDVADWFFAADWVRRPLGRRDATSGLSVAVFVDRSGYGHAVADELERAGHVVSRVEAGVAFEARGDSGYAIAPASAEHHELLLRELAARGRAPSHIVHCWSLTALADRAESASPDDLVSVALLAGAVDAAAIDPVELVIVTVGAQDVTGQESLMPGLACLHGLARVLPQEHSRIRSRVVDVGGDGDDRCLVAARQIAAELAAGEGTPTVAYRGGQRWVEQYAPRPLETGAAPRLRQRGVYLLTGGLGRVGRAIAKYLGREWQARLVIVTHSPLDAAREAIVREIEATGADVLTVIADVADGEAMRAAVERGERRFGALHGIVHAAGITSGASYAPAASLNAEAFARHLSPKAGGAKALAQAIDGRHLDFCVLASSLSTVLGGIGFGAYASANAFLDTFAAAQSRRSPTPWIAIDWDGWQFADAAAAEGTTAALAMRPAEGVETLVRVLNAPPLPRVIVSTAALDTRVRDWVTAIGAPAADPSRRAIARHARTVRTAFAEPASATQRTLAELWQELIGVDRIGVDDDFFELGGHSLLATQLISRIRRSLGVDVSLAGLFANPTVARLAAYIDQRTARDARGDGPELLEQIRSLSAVERERLLREARRASQLGG